MPRPDRGRVSEGEHRVHAGRVRRRATLCCLSVPWTAPRTGTPRVPTSDGHLGRLPHGRPRAVGAGALSFTGSECHRQQYVEATPVCCEVLHYLGRALSSMVAHRMFACANSHREHTGLYSTERPSVPVGAWVIPGDPEPARFCWSTASFIPPPSGGVSLRARFPCAGVELTAVRAGSLVRCG